MHPSLRTLEAHVHKPLIRFLGKRQWPSQPESPHPHPWAPLEVQKAFSNFSKPNPNSMKANKQSNFDSEEEVVYKEFWEAPERIWKPRSHFLSEAEIEAVLSGGATLR